MGVQHTRRVRAAPGASDPAAILMRGWLAPHPLPPAAGPANGASPPPEVGAPLALLPYLPRGLRSPLFGRPQP